MVCPRCEELRRDVPLYDPFSADYDRFVNWKERLAYELPFIETINKQNRRKK